MTNPPAAQQDRRLNLTDEECEELATSLDTYQSMLLDRDREHELIEKANQTGAEYWSVTALRELADLRRTREELAVRVAELERERDEARRAVCDLADRFEHDLSEATQGLRVEWVGETGQQIALARAAARKEE